MKSRKNKGLKKNTPLPTLDLHGMQADDSYNAVEKFIYKHVQQNTPTLRIMPGKGTGVVKAKVLEYLKQAGYSWHYEKQKNGKNNEGVIVVPL